MILLSRIHPYICTWGTNQRDTFAASPLKIYHLYPPFSPFLKIKVNKIENSFHFNNKTWKLTRKAIWYCKLTSAFHLPIAFSTYNPRSSPFTNFAREKLQTNSSNRPRSSSSSAFTFPYYLDLQTLSLLSLSAIQNQKVLLCHILLRLSGPSYRSPDPGTMAAASAPMTMKETLTVMPPSSWS